MQHVKWLKLFIYSVNLFWLNLPPVFVHRQDQIGTKIAYVYPKILPPTNWILHRHACGACDKFHVCAAIQWKSYIPEHSTYWSTGWPILLATAKIPQMCQNPRLNWPWSMTCHPQKMAFCCHLAGEDKQTNTWAFRFSIFGKFCSNHLEDNILYLSISILWIGRDMGVV